MDVLSPFIPVLYHCDRLFHSVHVLMLSTQVRPCVIFFDCMHLSFITLSLSPCFVMVWPYYASILALTVSNSSLFTQALLRTHLFVFFLCCLRNPHNLSVLSPQRRQDVFLHSFWVSSFLSRIYSPTTRATLALSLVSANRERIKWSFIVGLFIGFYYCLQCCDVGWAAGRTSGLWCSDWLSVWSEVQTFIWHSWCHCHSLSLASVKPTLVLPFWYKLTRVVPDRGPSIGCMYV